MTQNRSLLTIEVLEELASAQQPPCLSLYQSTHRNHLENQQDSIRFHNFVREIEVSLRQKYPIVEIQIEEFGDRAWKVVEPQYKSQLASLVY
jgi:hypothetical protein